MIRSSGLASVLEKNPCMMNYSFAKFPSIMKKIEKSCVSRVEQFLNLRLYFWADIRRLSPKINISKFAGTSLNSQTDFSFLLFNYIELTLKCAIICETQMRIYQIF